MFVSTSDADSADAYQGGLFSQQRVTSYVDILQSEEVANRVIDRLDLDTSASALVDRTTATVKPDSVILDVSVTDPDPETSQQLTDAVSEEFIAFVADLETAPGRDQPPVKVSIVDAADVPDIPVSPQPVRNLGIGAGARAAAGRRPGDPARTRSTRPSRRPTTSRTSPAAPVLGSVRFDAQAVKRPLVTDLDSHAPRVEAFRVLRTNLQFVRIDKASKVIVITSSVPEEGKTTTAVNLAITLAQSGQRVCLLEADLRRPKVAEYLRMEGAVGLTTVLIGRATIDEALQPWGDQKLGVLTSGAIPPNPAELRAVARDAAGDGGPEGALRRDHRRRPAAAAGHRRGAAGGRGRRRGASSCGTARRPRMS